MYVQFESISINPSLLLNREVIGRDAYIVIEPVTFFTQNKGATKLRYIPFNWSTVSL